MKKITLLFTVLFSFASAFSQTNLTTAVDFTKTDISGVERHLFGILDAGQYVLLDFFENN